MTYNQWINDTLNKTVKKIKLELSRLDGATPYIPFNGYYTDVAKERGLDWWTNGFWSGILWQMYHYTKDETFSKAAIIQEGRLRQALDQFHDIQHDVGFLFLHSAVAHYKELQNPQALQTGLHAATVLAGRYNIDGHYIVAWNDHKPGWTIIDSMMNLPLLYWASEVTEDPRFRKIAQSHANTIAKYLVHDDGTVGHIGSFDAESGSFIELIGGQGYDATSAWSRGNSWAIYGFALSFRHTGVQYYLDVAEKIAATFIGFIEKTNYIPRVDFLAPETPEIYDTSAGLCAACGLLEIAELDARKTEYYQEIALKIIRSTEKTFANWNMEEDGIIGGGTEAYHRPSTYHVPLIYSDYFFIESLLRLKKRGLFLW